ncbi:MAG: 50S ribosomal protein L23, partial [Candidatus Moranbacteria bacterium]|nr:50S ribosomal protein L23 [Candidatus Moranbacteria bacterium]
NKNQIKDAIEVTYDVSVEDVNVINIHAKKRRFGGKVGKKSGYKKAVITLKKGDKIEFFQGA